MDKVKYRNQVISDAEQDKQNLQPNLTTKPTPKIKIAPSHLQIFVLTRRDSFEIRETISNSWAQNFKNNITFMVGDYCPNQPNAREAWICHLKAGAEMAENFHTKQETYQNNEQLLNQRIFNETSNTVLLDFYDTYRNLTLKVKKSYSYLLEKYPTANWFAKVDDDQFVRPEKLQKYLENIVELSRNDKVKVSDPINDYIVMGKIRDRAPVVRHGKWSEAKKDYIKDFYPRFPVGSAGHVVNRKVAQYFVDNQESLRNYQGEDVSVGIWLSQTNFYEEVKMKNLPFFENNGQCQNREKFIAGHNMNRAKLLKCYEDDLKVDASE